MVKFDLIRQTHENPSRVYRAERPTLPASARRLENDYPMDREDQRRDSYTGIQGVSEQDAAMVERFGLPTGCIGETHGLWESPRSARKCRPGPVPRVSEAVLITRQTERVSTLPPTSAYQPSSRHR